MDWVNDVAWHRNGSVGALCEGIRRSPGALRPSLLTGRAGWCAVVSASSDATIGVCRVGESQKDSDFVVSLPHHSDYVKAVVFVGDTVYSAALDGTVRALDINTMTSGALVEAMATTLR